MMSALPAALQGTVPQEWAGMKSLEKVTIFKNTGLKGCLPTVYKTRGVKLGQDKTTSTSSSSSSSSKESGSKDRDAEHGAPKSSAEVFAAAVVGTGITRWC
jgi:hypothetical protein